MSEHADYISALDHKYMENPVICVNEGQLARLPQSGFQSHAHGAMGVHVSGSVLVCGRCGEQVPTSPVN